MPEDIKTKTFEGRFEFPFEQPMVLHEMPDQKIGFEILGEDAKFVAELTATPECNDFRRLGSGDWVAYSTMMDDSKTAIRAIGKTIFDALRNLQEKLDSYR